MVHLKHLIMTAVVAQTALAFSAQAGVVIASTDFDGRTLSSPNTATGLNWTLNGVDDPGDMSAFNATPSAQAIFDGNALMSNAFVPGLNTGNGNTFWTTAVSLTVSAGSVVTLEDVVFDYLAVNGGQSLNVSRQSDFTLTVFDPGGSPVGSVDVVDVVSGSNAVPQIPTVTATFTTPIALSAPGTYTLQIKGGDYLGNNETGNHTGIDNLSIEGTVVPEPTSLALAGVGLICMTVRRRRSN